MNSTFEITYINEAGCPCKATIHDQDYYYWSHNRDKLTGKFYKVRRTIVGKFLDKLKNCTKIEIREVVDNAKQ